MSEYLFGIGATNAAVINVLEEYFTVELNY